MNVSDAIAARRSIRGFKPDAIAPELLEKIFATASLAPSNCNTQPWHTVVVSGQARKDLQAAIFAEINAGKMPTPEFTPGDQNLAGAYKDRQYQCAFTYYGTMGIERHEKDKRHALMLKNFEFFDAPHVAFISMPKTMGAVNAVDIGIYLQTLMLVLVEHGLASCAQGALALYPDEVQKIANIPEGNAILCGLSFGYEDVGARINDAIMDRAPLAETVQFIS
ncbi:MAG: nitroreductase [Zhongshania sp.]|uniref:nitroreductase n=1 Tax=Zhongshania sp. TaxID=1971902 RepID=UPI00263A3603|nr:nitroreductase [Zhongshania sp.]MDF1693416.1 nitroreductase [Zhongshania sp.]